MLSKVGHTLLHPGLAVSTTSSTTKDSQQPHEILNFLEALKQHHSPSHGKLKLKDFCSNIQL